ncbi:glycoside hydrolase family 130 protein [Paenibacillus radicis (ex Gao et al. 2016)]|uniref:Glycosidase n=1 Tax=Paenibacillus radicis (ex Gao et al. 2016) TaxID=1737354 RepID=A0A917HLU0_9BACL|nr:glycosidase [Paenibacillus radicis (ex Gao et al. 2016)]GGG83765.1 glycosidase [Paenibacillus radicis (ex Gao et al. 2016)]
MKFTRCEANPIVVPGGEAIRQVATFNPGVIHDQGKFWMYDRAASSLTPFQTSIGLLESDDGIHFTPVQEEAVFTGEMLGFPGGSVEDARVVKIDGLYYMCYALQPYAFDCWPTGIAVPNYFPEHYPEWASNGVKPMLTRSGIAVSEDGIHFKQLCYTTPPEIDDRDNALFPEKINGKFALLRRPMEYVGEAYGTDRPGMWISYSDDLLEWSEPKLLAVAQEAWEGAKIGAAATPLRTEKGWLVLYHGVDGSSIYRVGALLLDLNNPEIVIGRTKPFIMEPEEYYEKTGLVIPNVVFPTANLIIDDILYVYYGCCDTSIGLATVPVNELLDFILG